MDPADLKVDVRKIVMRPLHAKALTSIYKMFNTTQRGRTIIRNGWKAAGVTTAVAEARDNIINTQNLIDPFANLEI